MVLQHRKLNIHIANLIFSDNQCQLISLTVELHVYIFSWEGLFSFQVEKREKNKRKKDSEEESGEEEEEEEQEEESQTSQSQQRTSRT